MTQLTAEEGGETMSAYSRELAQAAAKRARERQVRRAAHLRATSRMRWREIATAIGWETNHKDAGITLSHAVRRDWPEGEA